LTNHNKAKQTSHMSSWADCRVHREPYTDAHTQSTINCKYVHLSSQIVNHFQIWCAVHFVQESAGLRRFTSFDLTAYYLTYFE